MGRRWKKGRIQRLRQMLLLLTSLWSLLPTRFCLEHPHVQTQMMNQNGS